MSDELRQPLDPGAEADGEPAAEVVELAPGAAAGAVAASGVSRQRWIIAALVTGAVLLVSVVVGSLLATRATPEVLRYVPASSVIVAELRPELPGDQRAKVGELLSHFPGFKDQTTLDRKIDESLDLIVSRLSGGETDYRRDVKPYLAGPAVAALTALPADGSGEPNAFLALTTDGTAACSFPADRGSISQTYRDVTLQVAQRGGSTACAIDGSFALVGDPDAVRAAIDTRRDGGSIVDDASFHAAQAAMSGDHVAAAYVNPRAIIDSAGTPVVNALPLDELPAWFSVRLRAEDDSLVADGVWPIPEGAPAPAGPDHVSDLAARLPASVVVAAEGRDLGASIRQVVEHLKAEPSAAPVATEIENALRTIGGVDTLTGWLGDAAVCVTIEGDTLSGGVVIQATDEAKAAAMLASIHNLIVLAGTGSQISLEEVDHDGTAISVVTLDGVGAVLGLPQAGAGATLEIAWAARDDLVVVGAGQGFVEAVLDTGDGRSLADNARYRRAMGQAGSSNGGQGFADLAAILEYAGGQASGAEASRWAADIEPWIAPLEAVAFTTTRDGELMRSRVVITVR